MQRLLELILSDKDNIEAQKYEFALRNIEVLFSEYLTCIDDDKTRVSMREHIKFLEQNMPTIFFINIDLGNDLKILAKPFSEVLFHKESGNCLESDALNVIHLYLGGGTSNL